MSSSESISSSPPLPPIDTGLQAYSFILAGFLIETLLWGPMFSNGVFLKYYAENPPYNTASGFEISLIGTIALFVGYASGLPLLKIYSSSPHLISPSLYLGLIVYITSLIGASFVTSVRGLIFLQGIGPGLASALCAFPVVRFLPEWFDKRKGIAMGIIFSGGGVGGAYMPILNSYLIDKVGIGWTLRIIAISTGLIAGLAIPFIRPRLPLPPRGSRSTPNPSVPSIPLWKTFASVGFWGCFVSTLLQGFGFFNVGLFLPRFSDTLGYTVGAALLSAFNVSCIVAQVMWGHFTDRIPPSSAMAISSLLSSLLVLLLWGTAGLLPTSAPTASLGVLFPFAILFGLVAGGFTSMWVQSASGVAGQDKERQGLLFSGFSIARGLGALLGPTIGSALYRAPTPSSHSWGSTGSPGLVSLVAVSLACSACASVLFARGDDVRRLWRGLMKIRVEEVELRTTDVNGEERI